MLNEKLTVSDTRSVAQDDLAIDVPIKEDSPRILSLHISSLHRLVEQAEKREIVSNFITNKGNLLPSVNISINEAISKYSLKYEEFSSSPTFLIRFANLLGASGRLEEEESVLRNAVNISQLPIAINELGENLLNQGKIAEAVDAFSSTNTLHGLLRLAYIALSEEDFENATKFLSNALAIDEFDFASRLLLGAIYFHKGNFHKAIREFRVAKETRPDSPTLFTHLATAYYALGLNRQAIRELRKSLALNPTNSSAQILHADILIERRQPADAIRHLLQFLKYDPNSEQALSRLANAYYEIGEYKRCLGTLRSLLRQIDRKDAGLLNNIALCHWNLKQRSRAEEIFILALNACIDNVGHLPSTLNNYILFLAEESRYGDISDITENFIGIINQLPDSNKFRDSLILNRIGALSRIKGSEKRSLNETNNWINSGNISTEFRTRLLSQLLYHYSMVEENLDQALSVAREALNLSKSVEYFSDEFRATVLNNIMYVFLLAGDLESAKNVLPGVAPLVHKFAIPTATFGMYHLVQGDYEKGTKLYDEAIKLTPNAEISYQIDSKKKLELAKYYLRHDDLDGARKVLTILSKRKRLFPVIER